MPWECYQSTRNGQLFSKLGIETESQVCDCLEKHGRPPVPVHLQHVGPNALAHHQPIHLPLQIPARPEPPRLPIVSYLKANAMNVAQLKLGRLFNGWTRVAT